jgi:Uma2 family endonuclease
MITTPAPRNWRVSRSEYEQLGELGFFRSKRVQLINGQVIEMNAMGSPHAISVSLCDDIVRRLFGSGHHVRCQMPLAVNEWSEPEPDIAVVKGNARDYDPHPTTAELVIEVADSSLELDRNVKPALYARAQVKEYWLVDLNGRCIEVFREPDVTAGAYRQRKIFAEGEKLSVGGREGVEVLVNEVLP